MDILVELKARAETAEAENKRLQELLDKAAESTTRAVEKYANAADEMIKLREKVNALRETNERIQKSTLALLFRREHEHLDHIAEMMAGWTAVARGAALEEAAKAVAKIMMLADHNADKSAMFLPENDPSERLWRLYSERAGEAVEAIRALKETTP